MTGAPGPRRPDPGRGECPGADPGAGRTAGPPAPRDAGLAAERTGLARRRTALAVGVVAVLTARLALSRGPVGAVVAALAAVGWLAAVTLTVPRFDRLARWRADSGGRVLPLIALASAGFAGLGVLLVLAPLR